MESREDIPRVSLGSIQDWQKVRAQYKEAVLQVVQSRLGEIGDKHERDAIMAHVNQLVESALNHAQPNLRINGQSFESLDENGREMEAFDESLDRLIWSLADNRLKWYKRIAETRRTVPQEIATTVNTLVDQHQEVDSTTLPPFDNDANDDLSDDEFADDQKARLEETLMKVSALAGELEQTTAQQYERAERVQNVASEIKALRP